MAEQNSDKKELKSNLEGKNLTIYIEETINAQNSSMIEKSISEIISKNPETNLKLDLSNLKDISSAGIRLLMDLKNLYGKQTKIKLENVSKEVYEILETTGLTEYFEIKKSLREVSIDNLKLIGQGANSKVYKLDNDKVIKVFNPKTLFDLVIKNENNITRNAFLCGVPTTIAYDIVKVGDCYGSIYEYLEAKDLIKIMEEDKEHLVNYIKDFTKLMKKMHTIEVDKNKFYDLKRKSLELLPKLKGKVLNDEEYEKLKKIYENIPDRYTFIHGDCHPGNVMVKDGKMIFIDLATAGMGHPIIDLMGMYNIYRINIHNPDKMKNSPLLKNFKIEELNLIWDVFMKEYLGTEDENILKKAEDQIAGFSYTRILFAEVAFPGYLPKHLLDMFKNKAIAFYDKGLEPICF